MFVVIADLRTTASANLNPRTVALFIDAQLAAQHRLDLVLRHSRFQRHVDD